MNSKNMEYLTFNAQHYIRFLYSRIIKYSVVYYYSKAEKNNVVKYILYIRPILQMYELLTGFQR